MSWISPSSPSRIRLISSCRFTEWRHIRPAAILRFFFSAASPALMTRRTPAGSVANDFSMKTLTPFSTAYSRWTRAEGRVAGQHGHVAGPQAVDRLAVGVEADEPPLRRHVDLVGELLG